MAAKGHTVVTLDGTEATCEAAGRTAGSYCTACNKILKKQEVIPALGHDWVDVVTESTCTEEGRKTSTCSRCGATKEETIPAKGHGPIEHHAAVDPTCTKEGNIEFWSCETCGLYFADASAETAIATSNIPALGHAWDEGKTTKEVTCTEDGKQTFTCSRCGASEERTVKAKGHTEVTDIAVDPGCETEGKAEGTHCSTCGEVLKKQEILPATGHNWNYVRMNKEATCTEDGVAFYACSKCGEGKQEKVPATGHKEAVIKAVDATCMTTGQTAGIYCTVCNEVLKAPEVIPALGHDFDEGEVTQEATCTEQGWKHFTCKRCRYSEDRIIDASGHDLKHVDAKAVTCTENGNVEYWHCERCDRNFADNSENPWEIKDVVIQAKGHTVVTDMAVAATCTEAGKTVGSHCSVCNTVLKEQRVIPALGHDWDEGRITKEATCTEDGIKLFRCNRCGIGDGKTLPATGHEMTFVEAKEATCIEDGNIEHWHCEKCGKNYDNESEMNDEELEDVVIAAIGHKEVIDEAVEATCTEPGKTEGSHCSVCDAVVKEQEEIPALGHELTHVEAKDATCTEAGNVEYWTCERCQKNFSDEAGTEEAEEITIAKLGHELTHVEAKAATCTEAGNVEYWTCERCGKNYENASEEAIEVENTVVSATGHTEVKDAAVAATCTTAGKTEGSHCSVCNAVLKAQHTISATSHTVVKDAAVTATVLREGKTEGSHCMVCGTVLKKQNTIAKLTPTISLTATSLKMKTGQSTTAFRATGFATGDYVTKVISRNTGFVKVSSVKNDGTFKLTATKKTGSTTVTVYLASNKTASFKVTVQKAAVKTEKITTITRKLTLVKGTSYKGLAASVTVTPVTSKEKVTYASSNKKVATVNSKGVIQAKKSGTAKITVKSGKKKTVVTVTVTGLKTTKLSGVPATKKISKGKSFKIKAKATPKNTDEKIIYKSSNKKVATVNSKGVVKGLRKGTATITVQSGSKKMTCKVTVK